MMTLTFDTDGAAYYFSGQNGNIDLAAVTDTLTVVAANIADGQLIGTIHDPHGTAIGSWSIVERDTA